MIFVPRAVRSFARDVMERCLHFTTVLTRTIPYADSEVIFSYKFQFMEVFGMGKELSEMTLEAGDV